MTRKKVLLECLDWLRKERNRISAGGRGLSPLHGYAEEFSEAAEKVEILEDIIHYLDTDGARRGLADWQKKEMQDPEKCRREAMEFAK